MIEISNMLDSGLRRNNGFGCFSDFFNKLIETIEFHCYRDKDQYEMDMVRENSAGRFVGIEAKAAASIAESDFRGLRRFQRQMGKRFSAGVVLYDGKQVLSIGVPVCRALEYIVGGIVSRCREIQHVK